MIHPTFILNNYVKGRNLVTKHSSCNASYINISGRDYIIARSTNYAFFNPVYGKLPDGRKNIDFDPFICSDQLVFSEDTLSKVATLYKHPRVASYKDFGIEDIRVIKWNNEWVGFGVVLYSAKDGVHAVMHMFHIDDNFNICGLRPLRTTHKMEKNWQPIEDMQNKLIYSYKPFVICDCSDMSYHYVNDNQCNIEFSGSTPIVKYKNGYIGVIHIRNNENRQYIHFLVQFDLNMAIMSISPPFSFFGINIEFCTSMRVISDTQVDILMSVNDQLLFEFSLTDDDISAIFNGTYVNTDINLNIYDMMYTCAINNQNYLTAACLATWSHDKKLIADAIKMNHIPNNVYGSNQNFIVSRKYYLQQMLIKRFKSIG